MKLIAHRGNLYGPSDNENSPSAIGEALSKGYDVEVDVWHYRNEIWLGHDKPRYQIDTGLIVDRRVWLHAKDLATVSWLLKTYGCHYFVHENDPYTITSNGYIWGFEQYCLDTNLRYVVIAPESIKLPAVTVYGVCSDYVGLTSFESMIT